MENYNQDRIDAYIRGEMSSSERASFLKDLSQDPELRKDYEFTRNIANSISDRERKKRQIREWNRKSLKTVYLYPAITSIAAILIVGFFLFRNLPSNDTMSISDNYSPQSLESYDAYTEIGKLIETQNYSVALKRIEKIERMDNEQVMDTVISANPVLERIYELKWYKVQALLGLNRISEAYTILKDISNSNSGFKVKADSLLMELQLYNK